jgi:HK97 family phage portal protein
MGLGRLLTRSTVMTAKDTVTGAVATFVITDNLAPNWPSSDAYRGGMSIPGAWRASTMLAGLLGQVPWNAYRELPGRPEQLITPRPPLLEQPAPPDTRMTTFSSWMLDYIWHGNGVGVVAARNGSGWPTAALPIPATMVGVRRITPYSDSPLPIGALEYQIGRLRLGSQDVIHIKGPCAPGAVRGMGVLESHLNTFALADEQSRQARSISQHGVPTGVLTTTNPDATQTEMAEAKVAWLIAQRERTVAALGPTIDFKPLSWNPEELEMVEARKFTLTELELIFGLPVGWLGGQTSSKVYSNVEVDAVNLLKFGSQAAFTQFEQTLSLSFPRFTVVRANLDAVLRPDTLTRYQAHQIASGNKAFLTVDEIREIEHRGPMPLEEPVVPDAVDAELAALVEAGTIGGKP